MKASGKARDRRHTSNTSFVKSFLVHRNSTANLRTTDGLHPKAAGGGGFGGAPSLDQTLRRAVVGPQKRRVLAVQEDDNHNDNQLSHFETSFASKNPAISFSFQPKAANNRW